ncbi:hypothetical protein ACFVXD_45725, partial [Kitasatospora herbaricolor]
MTSNVATSTVGQDNSIKIPTVSSDSVDYIVDLNGWYQAFETPTVSCPNPYTVNSWSTTLPSGTINCTVHLPATSTTGILSVRLNDLETQEVDINGQAIDLVVGIPAAAGWYGIDVAASYSNDVITRYDYGFGLWPSVPNATIAALQKANPESLTNLSTGTAATAEHATDTGSSESAAALNTSPTTGATVTAGARQAVNPDTGDLTDVSASSIGFQLPFAAQASDAVAQGPGVVAYDNHNGSTTVGVVKADTSVQLNTVINNAQAPTRYDYQVAIPTGAHLSVDSGTGSVQFLGTNGELLGAIDAPWATDANGNPVPTHYEVNGTTVTQVVGFTSTTAFPVVADPKY